MKKFLMSAVAAAAMAAPGLAQAATISLVSNPGPLAIDGASYAQSFSVGQAGAGTLSMTLLGFASVDGDNSYSDYFSISVNGSPILNATFALGGGGFDQIVTQPALFSYTSTGPQGVISFAGGTVTMSMSVALLAGLNNIAFTYTPVGPSNGAGQSVADEAWGWRNATVTSAVPEPATWAMMLIGFAGLAGLARRRRALALV